MTTAQHNIGSGFGAHSTAAQVSHGIDLSGKLALVTGGYSGLGLETTRALASAGAHVVVPARRPDTAKAALEGLGEVDEMDLADLQSVRTFAERFRASGRRIDIVIGNAATMATPETRVGPGRELQFATNHLGHFALVNRLWPAIAPGARVVSVSSRGHHFSPIRWDDPWFDRGYDKWQAYGQAKTANVLFAVQLDRLGQASGVRAFAVHPGSILTPLQRHIPREEKVANGWIDENGNPMRQFKTAEQGAATQVWAATSARLAGLGGVYCEDCDIAEPATDEELPAGRPPAGAHRRARPRDRPGRGHPAVDAFGGTDRRERVRLSENGGPATRKGPAVTDQWHQPLRHIKSGELSGDTAQTSGMRRLEAISGKTAGSEKVWMGETHVGPATNSGDHHHGEAETAIYVKSGHPVFVFADGEKEVRLEAGPGDYIFVPPYVPHREENPGEADAVVIIARSSQEAIVVNLPSLWAPVERSTTD